jgi:acyl carrier protein
MNQDEIRAGVVAEIMAIAPEVEADTLIAAKPLRQQVDLDSMDWLNVLLGLHERFAVDIPEADYAKLGTLDAIVTYLGERLQRQPRSGA